MVSTNDHKVVLAKDLNTLLAEKSDMVLIDLLPPGHFDAVHIPNAKSVCVFLVSFLDDLADIVPGKQIPVVVYGASALSQETSIAVDKMARAGYQNIHYLEGGLESWREAGFALDGEAADQPDEPQTTVFIRDGKYTVNTAISQLEWAGRNPNARHFGTVDIANGVIESVEGKITGMIEIDMTSIHNVNLEGDELQSVLEAHLSSDDFFVTKIFPKAVFNFEEIEPIEPGWATTPNFHVRGELTLRGISAALAFDTTVTNLDDGSLALEAHFDIDRTRWNVIYGSARFFEHLGMHKVFDMISLQLQIVAER